MLNAIWLSSVEVQAQVSIAGRPEMNAGDFDAVAVMYVLPPLPAMQTETLKSAAGKSVKKSLEYAVERPVDLSPQHNGQWIEKENRKIWRAHIISANALSIGAVFDEFRLTGEARLFIYTPDGKVIRGAFSALNNKAYGKLFVAPLPGDELIIELQVPSGQADFGDLRIGSVSHGVIPLPYLKRSYPYLGTSQDCEIDVNCVEGDDWQILKRSVSHVITPTQLCTGILVNNTAYNGKQYLLTAEHCISSNSFANNSAFVFGYENSACGEVDGTIDKSVSGATLLATGDSLDFTLLRIDEPIPSGYNVYYSGWDVREANFKYAVSLHHPNADAMKISIDVDSIRTPKTVPGDLEDYVVASNLWVRQWNIGTTEGGSSGSPLFNNSTGKLVGLLSGGLAGCGDSIGYNQNTDRIIWSLEGNEDDYYSRLSYAWDYYEETNKQLRHWLDPLNNGAMTIGGLNPATLDNSASLQAVGSIRIYPNPAEERIIIESGQEATGDQSIKVYNLTGKPILSIDSFAGNLCELDITDLSPGIYIVTISGQHTRHTEKIVIR